MGCLLSAYVLPHPPIMLPEIGEGREVEISNTIKATKEVAKEIAYLKPDTIIVISPHGLSLADQICITTIEDLKGDFRNFDRKDIELEFDNDVDLTELIIQKSRDNHFPLEEIDSNSVIKYDLMPVLDHGAMVPLASILKYYKKFKVVHISMGFIDFDYLDEFGKILREAIDESDSACVLISSGDLSHKLSEDGPYGYSELAKVFDEKVTDIFRTSKLGELSNIPTEIIEDSAQCGLRSFITLAGCFDSKKVRSKLLSYEGPFGVGYCVAKINE